MDDPLLMGVLDAAAHLDEQLQPLPRGKTLIVAVPGDRRPLDQLHDEVGPAGVGCAGVEHAGDVRVVHQRQGLALGLEAGDDLRALHARLEDLERDGPADGLALLGLVHPAEAAFADELDQRVMALVPTAADTDPGRR